MHITPEQKAQAFAGLCGQFRKSYVSGLKSTMKLALENGVPVFISCCTRNETEQALAMVNSLGDKELTKSVIIGSIHDPTGEDTLRIEFAHLTEAYFM